jgi:hypothetical protein
MSSSSLFSSGHFAVQRLTPPPSPTQSVRPDSPILPSTPTREAATDITNQEPTAIAANPSHASDAERPKLRKRRSSLTANTSPLVQLKGSYRGATAAIQRQNRSRSGSINNFPQPCSVGFPIEEARVIGRLRSGSVGNSLRSRRRDIRNARPPPSIPLPPLPVVSSSVALHLGHLHLVLDTTRRHPITSNASTSEHLEQATLGSPAVLHDLDTGFAFNNTVKCPEDLVMKQS